MSHYDSLYSSSSDVALVHTVYGEPVEDTVRPNNSDDNVSLATDIIHRPYVKPEPPKVVDMTRCSVEECRGWRTKTGYCAGHSRSMGLTENWKDAPHEPD